MFARLPKHFAASAVAIGGLLLTCLSSWNVRHELQTSHQREFEWAAADRIQSVRAVIGQGLDALEEIPALFHSAPGSTRTSFGSSPNRCSNAGRTSTACCGRRCWFPRVRGRHKCACRRRIRRSGGQGEPRVPVLLSASRAGSGVAPGVDLNANGELAGLFRRARASGAVAVSGRMDLAREGREAIHVVYAALPIYATDKAQRAVADGERPDPLGFVIGIFNVEKMIHVAISLLEPRGVEVLVRDESGSATRSFSTSTPAGSIRAPPPRPPACCPKLMRISRG